MKYYMYVLYSPRFDKIYVGYTTDVAKRLRSHNQLATKGWTIRFRPWLLVHKEGFQTKKEAMAREKELKSAKGREWIRMYLLKQHQ